MSEHGSLAKSPTTISSAFEGTIILAIELLELFAPVGGHLLFGGRNDGVGMLAEKHAAQAFVGEKPGVVRSMRSSSILLAALALEFILGKRSVAREIGHQFEDAFGKLGEAGDGNRAGIGSRLRAEIGAHAAQDLLRSGGWGAKRCRCERPLQ